MAREAQSQRIAGGAPYEEPRNWLAAFGKYLILLLFAALSLYPLLLIVSTSLKDPLDVTADPFMLFSSFNPVNFYDAWTLGGFGQYFWTTVIITGVTVISVVAMSSLAGYALARFELPGNNIIFFTFILGLMIPFFSVMIPLFYELKSLSLLGTKAAVILPALAGASSFGLPLGVFLMRSFYMDLPEELADAARVEGANEFQVFSRIMLPLSMPGVAVLAVLVFFQTWNNFLLPLVYLQGSENQMLGPLPVRGWSDGRVRARSRGEPDNDRPRRDLLPDLPEVFHQGPYRRRVQVKPGGRPWSINPSERNSISGTSGYVRGSEGGRDQGVRGTCPGAARGQVADPLRRHLSGHGDDRLQGLEPLPRQTVGAGPPPVSRR